MIYTVKKQEDLTENIKTQIINKIGKVDEDIYLLLLEADKIIGLCACKQNVRLPMIKKYGVIANQITNTYCYDNIEKSFYEFLVSVLEEPIVISKSTSDIKERTILSELGFLPKLIEKDKFSSGEDNIFYILEQE